MLKNVHLRFTLSLSKGSPHPSFRQALGNLPLVTVSQAGPEHVEGNHRTPRIRTFLISLKRTAFSKVKILGAATLPFFVISALD
jgi:hypothetical protein